MPKEKTGNIIKRLKVNKNNVVIYFSNGNKIDISYEAYASTYLYVGRSLDDKEIASLLKITSVKKLSEYAISILTKAHYTENKMREKLKAKGGDKDDINFVISRLKKLDLIDDAAYIEDYIGYATEKGYGKNKIKKELLEKGIFAVDIAKIKFPETVEKKKALSLIPILEKKYEKYAFSQKKQHIYAALVRYGYESDVINFALAHLSKASDKSEKKKAEADYKKIYARFSKKYTGRELREKVYASMRNKGYKYSDFSHLLGGIDDDF